MKRAYGDIPPALALFADNMYYKSEAYTASEFAAKILYDNGLTPIYVSDNPVLNAQHVVFEAAKGYKYGLPYHAAMASVTTAPAFYLGMGERLGKIKLGFDADVVVWDSDPLSVGAAPVQVWIDGTAQFEDPYELGKPTAGRETIVPDEKLQVIPGEPIRAKDVVFTGVSRVFYGERKHYVLAKGGEEEAVNVAISDGKVTCIGKCDAQLQAASESGSHVVHLDEGSITHSFTAFGSLLGLNEIDAEAATDNGPHDGYNTFSRAVDALSLDTKKLLVSHRYGVTRAITAPKYSAYGTGRLGTSVGFRTSARTALEEGAVFGEDIALHYSLTDNSKTPASPSMSALIGAFRTKLLDAIATMNESTIADPTSEAAFLQRVVKGHMPLVLNAHKADTIAAILRVKSAAEDASSIPLRMLLIGGAEAHLLAAELAEAGVGVVLAPLLSYRSEWEERRALTGAPITNGTGVDVLLDAGVRVAIGLEEDWVVRDLGLLAGVVWRNGQGRVKEEEAMALVGGNIYAMLGIEEEEGADFVVWEGSPLEIGGRVRGVGSGGTVDVVL